MIFLQPNLIEWGYIIVSWSVLRKNEIVVSKIKVTVKVQTSLNIYVSYIFCATDLLATKEGTLIYYS